MFSLKLTKPMYSAKPLSEFATITKSIRFNKFKGFPKKRKELSNPGLWKLEASRRASSKRATVKLIPLPLFLRFV